MRRMDGSEEEVGHDGGYPVDGGNGSGNIPGFKEQESGGTVNPGGDIADTGNSETPRERAGNTIGEMNPNVSSTPRKPMTPDIGAGSVETHSGGDTASGKFTSRPSGLGGGMGASTAGASQGVIPFRPMSGGAGSPMSGPIGSPGGSKSTLFGMAGGLKGGGLGVPSIGDIGGTDSGGSSLIDSLMSILKQKKGGMF